MLKRLFIGALLLCLSMRLGTVSQINPQPGDSLWSIIQGLGLVADETLPGEPIPLSNADKVGGVITISSSGNYILAENITNGRVEITTSNISLMFNGRAIDLNSTEDIVSIASGLQKITLCNGTVRNTSGTPGAGIIVGSGCSSVFIQNILAADCQHGIFFGGQEGAEVTDSAIIGCDMKSNDTGVLLKNSDNNLIANCRTLECKQCGVELRNSDANSVLQCQAIETKNSDAALSAQGFVAGGGIGNLFQECIVKHSAKEGISNNVGTVATGFTLTSTEEDSKIIECLVNTTTVIGGDAEAYGMLITWTTSDLDSGPPTNCILQNNILASSGIGMSGNPDAFSTLGNLAIKNVAFNNNVNYVNVPNTDPYDATGAAADDTGTMDNADVYWP